MLCVAAWGAYAWHQAEQGAIAARADAEAAERQRATAMRERHGERDCADCPQMLVLPRGSFQMGSPTAKEGPQRRVTIDYAVSLAKYEVTRGEFEAFARATGYLPPRDAQLPDRLTDHWRRPGFEQTDRHPVVNVTWQDAAAYVAWLRKTTGRNYRLPSEAEWEYAARAGTTTQRFWGDGNDEACRYANVGDVLFAKTLMGIKGDPGLFKCTDGHAFTAPVGALQPNAWGLHDMLGNAQEWLLDCWFDSHAGAPVNGAARLDGDCYRRVLRGGSWASGFDGIRVADRVRELVGYTQPFIGFRVARVD